MTIRSVFFLSDATMQISSYLQSVYYVIHNTYEKIRSTYSRTKIATARKQ